MKKCLIINCAQAGISGDLFLSALSEIISIQKMQEFLDSLKEKLKIQSSNKMELKSKISFGLKGTNLILDFNKQVNEVHINLGDLKVVQYSPDQATTDPKVLKEKNEHSSHHLSPSDIRSQLDSIGNEMLLSASAQQFARQSFDLIMQAEASVHHIPIEKVHLHEIGALDTLIDLLGVSFGLDKLGVFEPESKIKIYAQPIAVGGGTVQISHGQVSVPAPATLEILKKTKLHFIYGPENRELATPTGVALLGSLALMGLLQQREPKEQFGVEKIGVGVGNLTLENRANVLQIIQASIKKPQETVGDAGLLALNSKYADLLHPIYELETNVDDVRGEILGNIFSLLLDAGALDVSILNTITKKNRPGYLIRVLCNKEDIDSLTEILLRETGTLGIRVGKSQRICLHRKILDYPLQIGEFTTSIPVKCSLDVSGQFLNYKIEFSDLEKLAKKLDIAILKLENLVRNQIQIDKIQQIAAEIR